MGSVYLDGSASAQGTFLTRISEHPLGRIPLGQNTPWAEHQGNIKGQQTSESLDKLGSG